MQVDMGLFIICKQKSTEKYSRVALTGWQVLEETILLLASHTIISYYVTFSV